MKTSQGKQDETAAADEDKSYLHGGGVRHQFDLSAPRKSRHRSRFLRRDPSPWLLLGGWGDFRPGGGRGEDSKFVTGQILTFQRRELTTTQHWTGAGK